MNEPFEWRQLDRNALLQVFAKTESTGQISGTPISDVSRVQRLPKDAVLAAFKKESGSQSFSLMGLYVDEAGTRDLFAWISTYLTNVCPLTQICRVQPLSDSVLFEKQEYRPSKLRRSSAWSGVIVGECLAQLGQEPVLRTAPLSAALATFSFPIARYQALWGKLVDVTEVVRRLQLAAGTANGRDRRLAVQRLEIVWRVLRALELDSSGVKLSPMERAIVQACEDIATSASPGGRLANTLSSVLPSTSDFGRLNELTAEERLTVFDRVLDSFLSAPPDPVYRDLRAFAVSVAAWAVGLGDPKHIQLLWPAAEETPILLVWFGLLAGLQSTAANTGEFGSFARLVERELSYSFATGDPPRADIGILEYTVYQEAEFGNLMKDLRRAQVRTLTIELMPGVTFTKAFGSEMTRATLGQGIDDGVQIGKDLLKELDEAFAELWAVRNRLWHGDKAGPQPQSDLFPTKAKDEGTIKKRRGRLGTRESQER